MPRVVQWVLAVLFMIGFGFLVLQVLPDSPMARYVADLIFLLAAQPALRLAGMTEANYWKMFPVLAILLAALAMVPRTRFDYLVTLGILTAVSVVAFMRLIRWLRSRPRSA